MGYPNWFTHRRGTDGFLYVSAGEGASFTFTDYGQGGGDAEAGNRTPNNPCLDPDSTPDAPIPPFMPNPRLTLPDAEGGALRSQDLLTAGDPIGYDGTVLRIDPDTGAAAPGNPITTGDEARIIAHGLRNPYRLAIRPGTNEVWIGDVGWGTWEEINVITDPGGTIENFGWPCYEGNAKQPNYDGLDIDICESLYGDGSFGGNSTYTTPFYSYGHGSNKPDATGCPNAGASVSGMAFPQSTTYPASYTDALVFSDFSYQCTWTMFPSGGTPDPGNIQTLVSELAVVDLRSGPGGELYLSEFVTPNIAKFWRLTYPAGNGAPTASFSADTTSGDAPLTVMLDGTASSDPDGDQLEYAWDLDDDGQFDDATGQTAQITFSAAGTHDVRLRVGDFYEAGDIATVTITVMSTGNPPVLEPIGDKAVDEETLLSFTAEANDPDDDELTFSLEEGAGAFPTGAVIDPVSGFFTWTPTEAQGFGVYDVTIKVTDDGLAQDVATVEVWPETVDLTFDTWPQGLDVTAGLQTASAPVVLSVIVGSTNSVSVPIPQTSGGTSWTFESWSDGGARAHDVVAPAVDTSHTATFILADPPVFEDVAGSVFVADIEWLAARGITRGCNPPMNTRFCPTDHVTRGQMAAFLVRALGLPSASGDFFVDDDGSTFEDDINRIASVGITKGCNPPANDRYCAGDHVTRGQVAAFLVRALGLPSTSGAFFIDDDGSTFEDDINRLAAAGITLGCNPPTNNLFCPNDLVTRGQMAAFLHRAFG